MTGGVGLGEEHVFVTPGGRRLIVHERVTHPAVLGVRFWDQGQDREVRDGLEVRAHAVDAQGAPSTAVAPVRAQVNPDGVYTFHRLPGRRALEEASPPASPPEASGVPLVLEVRDRFGRFLPVALRTPDPFAQRDLFLVGGAPAEPASPPDPDPRFYLFAAPGQRPSPRTYAVVRLQLWHRSGGRPAAHALVEVAHAGRTWYGLADARGAALVVFPYPPVTASLAGSPPPLNMEGLYHQSWELEVRVRARTDGGPAPIPRLDLPDFGEIAGQPYARVLPSEEGGAADSVSGVLQFGRELVVSTAGKSELWLE